MSIVNFIQIRADFKTCCFSLLSLFSSAVTLDNICQKPGDTEQPMTCTLRKIVNRLRRYKQFVSQMSCIVI